MSRDGVRDASEQKAVHASTTVRPDDDAVALALRRAIDDGMPRIALLYRRRYREPLTPEARGGVFDETLGVGTRRLHALRDVSAIVGASREIESRRNHPVQFQHVQDVHGDPIGADAARDLVERSP